MYISQALYAKQLTGSGPTIMSNAGAIFHVIHSSMGEVRQNDKKYNNNNKTLLKPHGRHCGLD